MSNFKTPRQMVMETWRNILVGILAVMVVIAGAGLIYYISQPKVPSAIRVMSGPDGDLIGISDGSYAFDVSRSSQANGLKSQASDKFRSGDKNGALSAWHDELAVETNDAEAQIYQENQHILASGKPYITLVIGTTITGNNTTTIGIGRDTLQGAYVAQKEHDDPILGGTGGGKLLRLLIANSGSNPDNATLVAKQIVDAAQQDKTIMGVMGWTLDEQTLNAIKILSAAKIPMVSPTASSDKLTGTSFCFRVVPSNKTQALAGARYIKQQFNAQHVALFVDPNNAYSSSLANDFSIQFSDDRHQIVDTEEYKVGDPGPLPGLLDKALTYSPDLIYFAGYSSDLTKLLELHPALTFMGGDGLYQLGGYADTARAGFIHLQFTSFAYPDEWTMEGQTAPPFFTDYAQDFDPQHQYTGRYGLQRPTSGAMLSYDAMQALLQGYTNAMDMKSTGVTPQTVQQGLTKISGDQALQGVTGQISFGSDGDPVNKAVIVLRVVSGYIQPVDNHGVQGCFLVGHC